jgi:hypothetical protein
MLSKKDIFGSKFDPISPFNCELTGFSRSLAWVIGASRKSGIELQNPPNNLHLITYYLVKLVRICFKMREFALL